MANEIGSRALALEQRITALEGQRDRYLKHLHESTPDLRGLGFDEALLADMNFQDSRAGRDSKSMYEALRDGLKAAKDHAKSLVEADNFRSDSRILLAKTYLLGAEINWGTRAIYQNRGGTQSLEQALVGLRKAMETLGNPPADSAVAWRALILLGRVHRAMGKPIEALESFERASGVAVETSEAGEALLEADSIRDAARSAQERLAEISARPERERQRRKTSIQEYEEALAAAGGEMDELVRTRRRMGLCVRCATAMGLGRIRRLFGKPLCQDCRG